MPQNIKQPVPIVIYDDQDEPAILISDDDETKAPAKSGKVIEDKWDWRTQTTDAYLRAKLEQEIHNIEFGGPIFSGEQKTRNDFRERLISDGGLVCRIFDVETYLSPPDKLTDVTSKDRETVSTRIIPDMKERWQAGLTHAERMADDAKKIDDGECDKAAARKIRWLKAKVTTCMLLIKYYSSKDATTLANFQAAKKADEDARAAYGEYAALIHLPSLSHIERNMHAFKCVKDDAGWHDYIQFVQHALRPKHIAKLLIDVSSLKNTGVIGKRVQNSRIIQAFHKYRDDTCTPNKDQQHVIANFFNKFWHEKWYKSVTLCTVWIDKEMAVCTNVLRYLQSDHDTISRRRSELNHSNYTALYAMQMLCAAMSLGSDIPFEPVDIL